MPRLCTMYTISLHDRRACVPWQGVCVGAHGGACGRSAGHRSYRQPCCCPRRSCPCGEASARPIAKGERAVYRISFCYPAVGRYIRLLFRRVVGRFAGILFRTIRCVRLLRRFVVHRHVIPWTRVRIYRCRALSCTGCSFACLWDIGHAPTRRFAYLLLGAIRSDKRRTSIRSLFLMWKNTVKSQMR